MKLCDFLKKYILNDTTMRLYLIKPIPGLLCINYYIKDDMVVYTPINFNTCFKINDVLDDEHWIHQFDEFSVVGIFLDNERFIHQFGKFGFVGISEGLLTNDFPEIHIVVKHDNIEEDSNKINN